MKRKTTNDPDVFYLAFDTPTERDAALATLPDGVSATPKPGDAEPLVFKVTGAFEAERQRFEATMPEGTPLERAGHGYLNVTTQSMWLAWQLARSVEPATLYRLEKRA